VGRKEGRGIVGCNIKNEVQELCKFHDYDFTQYKGKQRLDKIARNLVDYEAGRTILETALGIIRKSNTKQVSLFEL
jgi:DNA (cytosine-5)-methyltransferase 1